MKKEVVSKSPGETGEIAKDFIRSHLEKNETLTSAKVIALYGDLGAGKTTFVQGLTKGLGISKRIISPTFTIIRKYALPAGRQELRIKCFHHIDLYRITNESDIKGLGIEEIINDPQNLVVIEWAEKMGSLLPEERIDIKFEYVDENKRKITVVNSNYKIANNK